MKTSSTTTTLLYSFAALIPTLSATASAIPLSSRSPPVINNLQKRAYSYRWTAWSSQSGNYNRFAGTQAPAVNCESQIGKVRFRQIVENWPTPSRSLFDIPLYICEYKVARCEGDDNWIFEDNCDISDEEVINRLVESGSGWNPPLTREEAINGVNHLESLHQPQPISMSQAVRMGNAPNGPTQETVTKDCKKWHTVQAEDSCFAVAQYNNIGLQQFYDWNGNADGINKGGECVGLWIGFAYCVGV
ncbi:hypothetical protein BJ508DRAFT_414700 [Ascobolus immersus RN42]|uniref:LysM domain-containing protein n=1 Tax=Ascobolus immersus RN42 TaxID=1160509 RepID=A0A3N4I5T4_ASCIM|nr:hypothetical protein BJ508DRAFT_414700 [Ascobolus immersus RN42]